jgi:hypothetical protein
MKDDRTMFTISRHFDLLAVAADLLSARGLHADAYRTVSASRVALRRGLRRVIRCDREGKTG